ncbi:RHS repeat-associated core domain-containing protein, partial [Escherichia coli]
YNRTKFLWDGMRLAQESRPEGTDSLYIYRDPGSYEPLARVDKAGKEGPNRILYFHTDVNGAPEEMTDSDGKIVWETGYQVWGNTIQEKDHGRVEQNLRYQGQYLDRETGLHYNLHRYYDPDVGRFMVTDPIGLAGGLNLYQYSPNPISWIDPLGLSACNAPGGYKKGDIDSHGSLSPGTNRAVGHGNNRSDGFIQSHHPIQDAWAQKWINEYKRNDAPGILLESSSGAPHANISAAQRGRRSVPGGWNTTLKHEFNKSYQEMINAGVPAS